MTLAMGGVGQKGHKTQAGMKVEVLIEWFRPCYSSCSGWEVLTLPNEVLERHGAAVEEQAGTECKIDTGGGGGEDELGGGGGGGGGGGRGRRWSYEVDTNVHVEAIGSSTTDSN